MNVHRYGMLDSLRGIAAVVIVGFHLAQLGMMPTVVPRGYLAVDFFFILSGFVLAHAYEKDLRNHLTLRSFILKRVIRLYPLALLGASMGVLGLLLKWWFFPEKVDALAPLLVSGALNLVMLPSFLGAATSTHDIFPGNGPLWSLFFELIANLLWAAYGIWLRSSVLILITLASFMVLFFFAGEYETLNVGYDTATFYGGIARVCFGFPLGVIIYRHRNLFQSSSWLRTSFALPALLIAVFAIPDNCLPRGILWIDMLLIGIALPTIVIVGAAQWGVRNANSMLGNLSYPIYVLHFPVLLAMSGLSQSLLSTWNVHIIAGVSGILVLVFSWMAWRWYDQPLRRILTAFANSRNALKLPQTRQAPKMRSTVKSQLNEERVNVRI